MAGEQGPYGENLLPIKDTREEMIMRTSCRVSVYFSLLLLACSCAQTSLYRSPVFEKAAIFPGGDTIRISLVDDVRLEGELLFASDDGIYLIPFLKEKPSSRPMTPASVPTVRHYRELVVVPVQDVQSIVVRGYANTEWWKGILFNEFAPAVLLGLVGAVQMGSAEDFFLIVGAISVPILLNVSSLYAGTPLEPTLKYPISEWDLWKLNMHARFPLGLTQAELERFLASIKRAGR
ncbi:hypothetical protein ACFL3X_00785 [Gemmatimonadota bacterium]